MLALAALATPALAQTGICGRTAVVQTFILAKIEGVSACADVTGTHLAAITGSLLLNSESITALAAGDFAGLTSLTNLYLNHNELTALPSGVFDGLTALRLLRLVENGLITLPAGVFAGLTALRYLYLQDNALATLPSGVFAGLTALTDLTLFDNVLIALPADVFEPLTSLTILQLQRNDLATLPAGVFDALTALTDLQLHRNNLTTLPADVFEPLTSLTNRLYLDNNPGAPFAPVAVALPDDGTVSSAGGTVMLDGRGSDGGPWGEYVTYSWALTNPSSGVTVTFDDAGSATPVVTIPALAANTELTFTLTVAARSGSDGVTRGTDAARVTATTVPGAPTGLTATASGTTQIDLSWSAPASTGGSAITGYKIEVSANGTSGWTDQVANTGNANTTYAHTGLASGDTRHYRVSAINANGAGTASNVDSATTASTNTAAMGAPTITGTAQVGQTLTAATTGITDADGLTSPTYTYQWIRVDGTDEADIAAANSSTYTLVDADLGTTIKVKVSFTDDASNSETLTSAATVTVTTTPGAPTGLAATANGPSQIDLAWSAPASTGGSAITGYKIEVSPNGTSGWTDQVANTGNANTTYAHTGLTAGTTRHYRVSAINANGTGVPSNVDSATTGTTVPGAPTGLTATASGTTQIDLSWTAPASTGGSAITGYKIEVSANGTSGWTDQVANTGNANTTYAHTGLTAGTTRHYRVSAINANGTGVPSNVDSATTGTTVPGAPTGLTATASGTTQIDLAWSAPASTGGSAITGYKIESSSDGGSSWSDLVANTSNTTTTYAHTGLTAGTTRHYRVSAINANGAGTASNVDSATTGTTVPGAPTGLTATASGTTQIDLAWSAPASTGGSAITGYKIEVSANGTSGWTDQVANTGNATTTYAHTGLAAGDTRHYRVSAINANGAGTASNVDSATTGTTVPGAPTGLTATASGTTAINLSWSAPASTGGSAITGYKIEVSPDGSSWSDLVADTGSTDTAYAHVGLAPATTRHYRVSAINAVGTSDASDSDDTTTTASTNTAAMGAPTITGTAQVGQTLTAATTGITDADGLTSPTYTYQWIRVDGTDEADIAAANSSTYTLVDADLGTTIKVKVSFTDDASNSETLTSAATVTVTTTPGAPTGLAATANGPSQIDLAWTAPASTGGSAITGYNIEVSANGTSGWTDQVANTGNATTTYAHTGLTAGTTRHYRVSAINANGTGVPSNVDSATTGTTVPGAPTGLTATASGTTQIDLAWTAPASTGGSAITGYKIEVSPDGSSWSDLVADTGSTDTAYAHVGLAPATTRHYRVSAINAVGTSDASDSDTTTTTASTNTAAMGAPTITGTAQVGQTLTAATTGITDADGLTSPTYTYQWIRVDGTDEADIASANSSTYTLGAADLGTTIKVKVSFTDDANNPETLTSAATATVSAAANTPATGAPTITGTAQVGQTLTASTTGIADADGLTSPTYTYQWIRVDGTDEADISGENSSTYTLVDADLGTTLKVRVTFADDLGHTETLTSAATATVTATPAVPTREPFPEPEPEPEPEPVPALPLLGQLLLALGLAGAGAMRLVRAARRP